MEPQPFSLDAGTQKEQTYSSLFSHHAEQLHSQSHSQSP